MNILFITSRLPLPPVKGDRLRSFNFIKDLSKRHSIHLISFIESKEEETYVDELKSYCDVVETVYHPLYCSVLSMIRNFSMKNPLQVSYYKSRRMNELVQYAVKKNSYDIAHIVLVRMAQYVKNLSKIPVIFDHIDCLSLNMYRRADSETDIFKKYLFMMECKSMRNLEFKYRNIPSIVTSEDDKKALNGYKKIKVIQNGVDFERFGYIYDNKLEKDIDVLFVGNLGYFPNFQAVEFFMRDIYSLLKRRVKHIRVFIVGPNPNKKIKSYVDNKNVFVTGFVKDVRGYIKRAKVVIAPMLSGSGIQNKILEAMSSGVPVISTNLANKGINARDGQEIIIADDSESFVDKTIFLLNSKNERKRVSLNARTFIEKRFSWGAKVEELEMFYSELLV